MNQAKTAIEEQGVNILYLSFGFLKWKEINESEQIITSPIVLVPVILRGRGGAAGSKTINFYNKEGPEPGP
ncbi:DUF4011 domain-containing protein [Desulfotruncus arcticus]|uniref:DUF4011 domain-containing protein n=1 Tax=Desulfotruncus arcticus TaxID=341036 RepID=UPI000B873DFC